MKRFLYHNGLSIAFIILFFISIMGQIVTGIEEYNKELLENGGQEVDYSEYLKSGHFIEATFENWESEFLQMFLFVVLTIFLKQKGSSESKSFEDPEQVDRIPLTKREDAPWPVKKGGFWLSIYKNSLSLALLTLFILSFILHLYGSWKEENTINLLKDEDLVSLNSHIFSSKLWFESFQNWQSEFLSIFVLIVLSIFLRQYGSPQSKPVDAPNKETGE